MGPTHSPFTSPDHTTHLSDGIRDHMGQTRCSTKSWSTEGIGLPWCTHREPAGVKISLWQADQLQLSHIIIGPIMTARLSSLFHPDRNFPGIKAPLPEIPPLFLCLSVCLSTPTLYPLPPTPARTFDCQEFGEIEIYR